MKIDDIKVNCHAVNIKEGEAKEAGLVQALPLAKGNPERFDSSRSGECGEEGCAEGCVWKKGES